MNSNLIFVQIVYQIALYCILSLQNNNQLNYVQNMRLSIDMIRQFVFANIQNDFSLELEMIISLLMRYFVAFASFH